MIGNINIFENFLSPEECDYILSKYTKELKLSTAQVTNDNHKSRKSSVGWIDELNDVNERLTDLLKLSYDINGMEVTGLGPFQFTEYTVGEYFDWHSDRSREYYRDRFVSTVIQLNDNYEGGLLEIKDSENNLIPIKQKKGNLFLFDSGMIHRVTPVIKGERYSLVNWVSLNKTNLKKQNII